MPEVTVVYWRDIPAQVIYGRGRKASKLPLSNRFEQAIDRAAMRTGAAGTDAYLSEWRKAPMQVAASDDDAAEDIASAAVRALEAEYDGERLKSLVNNGGWQRPD